jgi:hypothetical protein
LLSFLGCFDNKERGREVFVVDEMQLSTGTTGRTGRSYEYLEAVFED